MLKSLSEMNFVVAGANANANANANAKSCIDAELALADAYRTLELAKAKQSAWEGKIFTKDALNAKTVAAQKVHDEAASELSMVAYRVVLCESDDHKELLNNAIRDAVRVRVNAQRNLASIIVQDEVAKAAVIAARREVSLAKHAVDLAETEYYQALLRVALSGVGLSATDAVAAILAKDVAEDATHRS